jgi:hypothetical protein
MKMTQVRSVAVMAALIYLMEPIKKPSCFSAGANWARDGSLHKVYSNGFGLCQIHL